MIVELCLFLRIILNEQQQFAVERFYVTPCCGATKDPPKDAPEKVTSQTVSNQILADISSPSFNSLWVYKPPGRQQANYNDDFRAHHVIVKTPHSVTKLAKSMSFGFDPYFSKGFFEPFERRPKPVTLVALRKNGLDPRQKLQVASSKSTEVAELQSPFNEVSNFWGDGPDDS